ncbi:isochorismatase family protein [Sporolactobacillus sp. CPB3-1]|uniref:Isochorismatase family protein n=1 Tax=Sporolactobacillus mangiferae TaxID=2940498 RepID=A0ABT0MB38_9BACL|nr:isochorismatase family protein [Sporolactobacillus mangiferae]MCL1632060.1 isochorismatase family protein [Sporolactobacillus mangiferae]
MRALLVIDVQQGFVDSGDYRAMVGRIKQLINEYQKKQEPIFFIQHKTDNPKSRIRTGTPGAGICRQLAPYVSELIEKSLPSAFYQTKLNDKLKTAGVHEVVLCGFNAEYCILFNSVAAFEHGYKVQVIEDACGSVNTGATYGMNDLDIPDFICTVLDNSGEISVNDLETYLKRG